jgi:cytochrome c oxidase assembly protein Cox11
MKTANAICKHILFFADPQINAEKNKKSLQANPLGYSIFARTEHRQQRSTGYTRVDGSA